MSTLTIVDADEKTVEVPDGERLVLAIERQGVHIGHRCGGYGRCTSCRVEFLRGEPETMTKVEYRRLKARGLLGDVRLSCQIVTGGDMAVRPLMTLESEGWSDTGPTPEPTVTPEAVWYTREALEQAADAGAAAQAAA
jgi:ferredoxin